MTSNFQLPPAAQEKDGNNEGQASRQIRSSHATQPSHHSRNKQKRTPQLHRVQRCATHHCV